MITGVCRLRKYIAVATVLSMVLALIPISSMALGISDISGHWAKDKIQSWVDQGLVKGYKDGTFRPDNNITRAEFMSMVNGAFGFTETAAVSYSDVDKNAWYSSAVAAAKAAGYLSGYPDNTIRPNHPISRAEAASIIMRINDLEAGTSGAAKFADESGFGWSRDAVNAVSAANIMNGYPDGTFKPQNYIKRAEAVAALDKALTYGKANITYSKAGTYGPAAGVSETEGSVTIAVKDVLVQNMIIKGNLIIGKDVGDGTVTLKNVTVKGDTKIYGGGQNSIIVIDSTLGNVTVSKVDGKIRIAVSGAATVGLVQANSGVTLEENNLKNAHDGFQEIILDASDDDTIILDGTFEKVTVNSEDLIIKISSRTTIETLIVNKRAKVTGAGTVKIAYINASGVAFETEPAAIKLAKDIKAPEIGSGGSVGGGGGAGGSGGGTPGGGNSLTAVSAVSVSGSAVVGQALTANPVPAAATVTYQWMRSDTSAGIFTDIPGATEKIYELTAEDSNKFLKVKVTGTGSYTGSQESSAQLVTMQQVATPSVSLSKTAAENREDGVIFTIEEMDGVTFYYTLDGTTPTAGSAVYTGAVTLTAPDQDAEATVTISAIGVRAGSKDSEAATVAVTYAAKPEEAAPKVVFTVPTAKETGTYYPEHGYSIAEINEIITALWGSQTTTIAGIYIKPVFSTNNDGSTLTINTDNITQSLLDWLEHDLGTRGNIAIGISFNNDELRSGENDKNIINGSEGTALFRLLVNSDDWEATTVRINLHDLTAGINSGGIRTTTGAIGTYEEIEDGVTADFEVVTTGNLTPVSSVTVTSLATTISIDDGIMQMNALVEPSDAYNKTIRWSVVNGSGVAAISNSGHGTTGQLFAGKNGTVEVIATSAESGISSEPFLITISGQVGPAAPAGIYTTNETYEGAKDGTLINVSIGQEYQRLGDDENSWISITGSVVTDLAPGYYRVRIAETGTAYAGTPTAWLTIE